MFIFEHVFTMQQSMLRGYEQLSACTLLPVQYKFDSIGIANTADNATFCCCHSSYHFVFNICSFPLNVHVQAHFQSTYCFILI